ncbi:MAG: segregation/condensation protein A [Calditrichia bacterium]|nr:segregation/condensation protein A [Calditrichia bacterium]
MSVKVKIEKFEGPFDLLLYLIRKNEINVWDIPIAEITKQYLEYVHLMQMLDLEIAGEFVEMVAILMLIKTRTLIPAENDEDDEDYEDPRKELALQLLEYARFKDVSYEMEYHENKNRLEIPHEAVEIQIEKDEVKETEEFLDNVTLFDLLTAFKQALDNMPKEIIHEVKKIKVTTDMQSRFVLNKLLQGKPLFFKELFTKAAGKMVVIVTFMSILDLMRMELVTVNQANPYNDFQLQPLKDDLIQEYEKIQQIRLGKENGAQT